jgi:hypothetical protein
MDEFFEASRKMRASCVALKASFQHLCDLLKKRRENLTENKQDPKLELQQSTKGGSVEAQLPLVESDEKTESGKENNLSSNSQSLEFNSKKHELLQLPASSPPSSPPAPPRKPPDITPVPPSPPRKPPDKILVKPPMSHPSPKPPNLYLLIHRSVTSPLKPLPPNLPEKVTTPPPELSPPPKPPDPHLHLPPQQVSTPWQTFDSLPVSAPSIPPPSSKPPPPQKLPDQRLMTIYSPLRRLSVPVSPEPLRPPPRPPDLKPSSSFCSAPVCLSFTFLCTEKMKNRTIDPCVRVVVQHVKLGTKSQPFDSLWYRHVELPNPFNLQRPKMVLQCFTRLFIRLWLTIMICVAYFTPLGAKIASLEQLSPIQQIVQFTKDVSYFHMLIKDPHVTITPSTLYHHRTATYTFTKFTHNAPFTITPMNLSIWA